MLTRWHLLKNKKGSKAEEKYRGEIEVILEFLVQNISGSQLSLNKAGKPKKMFAEQSGTVLFLLFSLIGRWL